MLEQHYDSIPEYAERVELNGFTGGVYFMTIHAVNRQMVTKQIVVISDK